MVQSDLATMKFNNRGQLEYFHSIILRLQQEIKLSGETVAPTILLFRYIKSFSKSHMLKAFIVTRMIDIITFPDNTRKSSV